MGAAVEVSPWPCCWRCDRRGARDDGGSQPSSPAWKRATVRSPAQNRQFAASRAAWSASTRRGWPADWASTARCCRKRGLLGRRDACQALHAGHCQGRRCSYDCRI